jgi:NADH:ubiquinone oxidoreductase subunit 4 (subunit M)
VGAAVGGGSAAVLAALTAFLIVFGVYPAPLIQLIERAVATLP